MVVLNGTNNSSHYLNYDYERNAIGRLICIYHEYQLNLELKCSLQSSYKLIT